MDLPSSSAAPAVLLSQSEQLQDRWREGGRNPFPTFYSGAGTRAHPFISRHQLLPDLPAPTAGRRDEVAGSADSDSSLDLSIGKQLQPLWIVLHMVSSKPLILSLRFADTLAHMHRWNRLTRNHYFPAIWQALPR
jgi:hypothetical protein